MRRECRPVPAGLLWDESLAGLEGKDVLLYFTLMLASGKIGLAPLNVPWVALGARISEHVVRQRIPKLEERDLLEQDGVLVWVKGVLAQNKSMPQGSHRHRKHVRRTLAELPQRPIVDRFRKAHGPWVTSITLDDLEIHPSVVQTCRSLPNWGETLELAVTAKWGPGGVSARDFGQLPEADRAEALAEALLTAAAEKKVWHEAFFRKVLARIVGERSAAAPRAIPPRPASTRREEEQWQRDKRRESKLLEWYHRQTPEVVAGVDEQVRERMGGTSDLPGVKAASLVGILEEMAEGGKITLKGVTVPQGEWR